MTEDQMEEIKVALRATVGMQLRVWMRRTEVDVAKLADRSKVSADTIYNLLGAKRGANLDSLALLAEAMDIPAFILLVK